jgi:membrane protein implicated in regulation of membrane protease activity
MSIPVLWTIVGLILCILEFVIPTALVELTMGISAIAVAIISPAVPAIGLQVVIWLGLSVLLNLMLKRLMPATRPRINEDSKEAQTLTEILPGQVGRVLYEGNSWQARCADEEATIAAKQQVHVVERRGTTLIVLPDHLLHS